MFKSAAADLGIDLKSSIMIGDHASDLIAAKGAGISNLFLVGEHIETEKSKIPGAKCLKDLVQVVKMLKNENK